MIFPFNIYQFLSAPENYLFELQNKYGDPFPLIFPGAPCIWLTGNSELAKLVFSAPVDSFKTSDKNPVGPLLGQGGLIMQSGLAHLSHRREFTPHFSKNSLRLFSSCIINIFDEFNGQLKDKGSIYLQEFALNSTLKIILKYLFPHLSQSELKEAEKLTDIFLKSYSPALLFVPDWVPGTWNSFNLKKKKLDSKFYEYFLSGMASNSNSVLNVLEGSPKDQVLDHIRTFIVAGHETSATSLSWALYHIYKDVYVKNRLQEELMISANYSEEEFVEVLINNQYLDSIVQESFRIQPPVPFVSRKIINRSFLLGNKTLNVDEELGVCISLLHRQPKIWENPAEFNPERFLKRKYSSSEFAPFGGGSRKCIGADLAILEIKILIGFFIKNYQAELIGKDQFSAEVMQITIGPKKPIYLSYSKRYAI